MVGKGRCDVEPRVAKVYTCQSESGLGGIFLPHDQSRSISVPSSIIILSLVILIPPLPCHVRTLETLNCQSEDEVDKLKFNFPLTKRVRTRMYQSRAILS